MGGATVCVCVQLRVNEKKRKRNLILDTSARSRAARIPFNNEKPWPILSSLA
jgi:hypothetical protein